MHVTETQQGGREGEMLRRHPGKCCLASLVPSPQDSQQEPWTESKVVSQLPAWTWGTPFPSPGLSSRPVKSEVRLDQGWQECETYIHSPLPGHADISNYTRLSLLSPDSVSEFFPTQHFRQLALEMKRVATPGLESPDSLPGHTLELRES